MARIAEMPAWAGISRRDELERAGEGVDAVDAHEPDLAFLERLPERLQDVRGELGHLVEEEDALVREGDLAGKDGPPSPDEATQRDRMVGSAEWPDTVREVGGVLSCHRVDEERLVELRSGEARQDRGHALRKHGLPRTGRPHHEQTMTADRRDEERALGNILIDDVREIGSSIPGAPVVAVLQRRIGTALPHSLPHGGYRRADEAVLERERPALSPEDEGEAEAVGKAGVCDGAARRGDVAVQRELAHEEASVEPLGGNLPRAREDGERDREVVRGTRLADLRR